MKKITKEAIASLNFAQVNEARLHYSSKLSKGGSLKSSQDVYTTLKPYFEFNMEGIEEFRVLLLNMALKNIGVVFISSGGQSATVVDIKMIFTAALLAGATNIILAHNHPSGSLKPSMEDIDITRKIQSAGDTLGISTTDHLILTKDGYFSLANQGII